MQNLWGDFLIGIKYGVAELYNTDGTTFLELFPNKIDVLSYILLSYLYENIQYDLFFDLADDLYYEIVIRNTSMAFGSERYFQEFEKHTEKWLDSGVYKQIVAAAFNASDEYVKYNGSQTFEEFIDDVYHEFGFEKLFNDAFPIIYNLTYNTLLTQGYVTISSVDLRRMTTDYMR